MRWTAVALAVGVALHASPAAAQIFPARSGESGLLDVPDAEVTGIARGQLGIDFRFDHLADGRSDFGPFPLYAVGGVTERLEMGLTMREWGQPGDPTQMLFGGALKFQLGRAAESWPSIAVDATVDRLNAEPAYGSRLILSTAPAGRVRFAAFAGGEWGDKSGVTYGGAVSALHRSGAELVLEALDGPRGADYGGAVRWRVSPTTGMSLGFNYLPDDQGWRVTLGFGFGPARRKEAPPQDKAAARVPTPEEAPTALAFKDERPHFRLRIPLADPTGASPRSLRHGPWSATLASAGGARPATTAAPGVRSAAPSLEDLAEAQLREQEALAEARERRVRATSEQLELREKAAQAEAQKLAEQERALGERELQLDGRDRRIAVRGPPTQQQRQLESLEAQLSSQERNLAAQERSFGPALDAAQGRERDAAAREEGERQEASRLAASVSSASSRALQIEIRKQALGAKNRQLAALEARLVAKGERIDALERQLRTRSERLDAWQRRLDARSERLDLLERRAEEPKAPAGAPAKPTDAKAAAAKEKAVFVMVVKSPTAIVKERAATPTATGPGAALHPGVAVEKAVAAATVVMFPTTTSQLSELDRETIDNIAKLAAKDNCELLIWARAKDPSLMVEAQRRAGEIRTRVLASGPLNEKQVVTRITTRPGAQGVDVVVSALRETSRPAAAPAPAPSAPTLLSGESGKRQIREAVQTAQPSIEACVGEIIVQKNLQRAEGVLKVTVSAKGVVSKVLTGDGDLSGGQLEECLNAASGKWVFPPAEAEYVVDVPITVIRGGAK